MSPTQINETVNEQFWYNADFTNVASTASSTTNVNIQADSDFVIIKQARTAFQTGSTTALVALPRVTVTLTDTGSGRQMMDSGTQMENIFGTAQFPYILPQAKRLSANSTLQVAITNSAGAAGDFQFNFSGFKQYIFRRNV